MFPQAREVELNDQYEGLCDSTYSEAESAAVEVLDLPLPSYFRSRSHSYLRAIQAGCSQEEDTVSVRSISPPPANSISGSRTLPSNSKPNSFLSLFKKLCASLGYRLQSALRRECWLANVSPVR